MGGTGDYVTIDGHVVVRECAGPGTGDTYRQTADGRWWGQYVHGDCNRTGVTVAEAKWNKRA